MTESRRQLCVVARPYPRVIPIFRGREGRLGRKSIPRSDNLYRAATHWRMRAEKMRMLAEEAQDSTVRAMMLSIAADYERLADNAGDRPAQNSIMFRTAARAI